MLNKRSPMRVRDLSLPPAAAALMAVFGRQQLHLGGPVQMDAISVLHRHQGLAGAHMVSQVRD